MLRKKKDFTKKTENKPQGMTAKFYEAQAWFEKFQREVIIGAVVLVVAVGAFFLMQYYKGLDNEKASLELARIISIYDSGSYVEAIDGRPGANIKGLKTLADQYDGTENGETAKIYLANSYYALGKYEEAKNYYDDYSGDNKMLKAAAYAGLAACYEAEKNSEEAASYYIKAADVTDDAVFKPQYLLYAGINYLQTGEKEKAEKLFKTVKKDFKNSAFVRDIDRYLAQVQ